MFENVYQKKISFQLVKSVKVIVDVRKIRAKIIIIFLNENSKIYSEVGQLSEKSMCRACTTV